MHKKRPNAIYTISLPNMSIQNLNMRKQSGKSKSVGLWVLQKFTLSER